MLGKPTWTEEEVIIYYERIGRRDRSPVWTKDDMKEVKDDLKMIFKSINEIQINFARMEARSEGKDEVIGELKNAVTTILQQRQ